MESIARTMMFTFFMGVTPFRCYRLQHSKPVSASHREVGSGKASSQSSLYFPNHAATPVHSRKKNVTALKTSSRISLSKSGFINSSLRIGTTSSLLSSRAIKDEHLRLCSLGGAEKHHQVFPSIQGFWDWRKGPPTRLL